MSGPSPFLSFSLCVPFNFRHKLNHTLNWGANARDPPNQTKWDEPIFHVIFLNYNQLSLHQRWSFPIITTPLTNTHTIQKVYRRGKYRIWTPIWSRKMKFFKAICTILPRDICIWESECLSLLSISDCVECEEACCSKFILQFIICLNLFSMHLNAHTGEMCYKHFTDLKNTFPNTSANNLHSFSPNKPLKLRT